MTYISPQFGITLLIAFGIVMLSLTKILAKTNNIQGFLLANRKIGWITGSTSIAASWLWAPALFVSVQLAYQQGLAGIFWFTFPNVIALALFALFAPRIRQLMPKGTTLPEYIKQRLGSRTHKLYLVPYVFYQIMAVTVQLFAGGSLLSLLTGVPLLVLMPLLAVLALTYTLVSGLKASIITDFIQLAFIFGIGIIILPMTWQAAQGGLFAGLSGLTGTTNIFDAKIAFNLGIVTSIGLIAGALSDQQYWQRSFAIKKRDLRKSFLVGAALFAIVPIALSTLGFIGAGLGISVPEGVDVSMIGVQTVAQLLPSWATLLFVIMLLAGLSSTLDSGLSAMSSLWVTDIAKKSKSLASARLAMIGTAVIGLLIALLVTFIPGFGLQHLWWVFNTIAACILVPTILSLYWRKLSERGVFWGVLTSFIIGIPAFIVSNILGNNVLIVASTLFIIVISTTFCLVLRK